MLSNIWPLIRFYRRFWVIVVGALLASSAIGNAQITNYVGFFSPINAPTAGSQPFGIVAGPDGALWFTERTGNKIARAVTNGYSAQSIQEYTLSQPNSEPAIITNGPDGNLWFTEYNKSTVGRITPSGVITEFSTPTANSTPNGISFGPDGNVWFTESNVNQIGRITPAGVITEFAIPTVNSQPWRIGLGPDGNLWFTESKANQIARITVAGTVSEFSIPTPSSNPLAIIGNYDGNLWFSEFSGNKIGVMTTAGTVIHEYPAISPNSQPASLIIGPDGNVWFDEGASNNIGFISSTGAVNEITLLGGDAAAMTIGPDGAFWLALQSLNSILRFQPDFVPDGWSPVAAVLPASRSLELGRTATAFVTVINPGPSQTACAIHPLTFLPMTFSYQTTDPITNAATGVANTAVSIGYGESQTFLITATATAPFAPTDYRLAYTCSDANAGSIIPGVNTILLSASSVPVPDIVALAATTKNDGILHISGPNGSGSFAIATVNLGADATAIKAAVATGATNLPVVLSICETDPATAQCISNATSALSVNISARATPTFSIFAQATAAIPFAPATGRIFVQFIDAAGIIRGSTSVAVETQ